MADGPHTANRPGNGEEEEEEEEEKKEERVKTGGEARKNIQHVIGGAWSRPDRRAESRPDRRVRTGPDPINDISQRLSPNQGPIDEEVWPEPPGTTRWHPGVARERASEPHRNGEARPTATTAKTGGKTEEKTD
jgi:hypothetical protein